MELGLTITNTKIKIMENHNVWFKRWFNPTLRKIFKVEICSLIDGETVIGYGIRKYKKLC